MNKHQTTFDTRGDDSTIYTYDDAAKNQLSSLEAQLLHHKPNNSVLHEQPSQASLQGFNCVTLSDEPHHAQKNLLSREVQLKERARNANFSLNYMTSGTGSAFEATRSTKIERDPLNAPPPKHVDKSVPTRVTMGSSVATTSMMASRRSSRTRRNSR